MLSRADKIKSLAGLTCTCPPNCTDTAWGNGPRRCAADCKPCKIMAGEPYGAL